MWLLSVIFSMIIKNNKIIIIVIIIIIKLNINSFNNFIVSIFIYFVGNLLIKKILNLKTVK